VSSRPGARIRYFAVAALLGLGWFPVLLVPRWTRDWLLGERGLLPWNLAFLALTSVIVAGAFRGAIERASGLAGHLRRAVLLPLAGCVIYLTIWDLYAWIRQLVFGGLMSGYETLILYLWGLASTLAACFVVVPYGLLCQYVMKGALEKAHGAAPRGGLGAA